MTEARAGKINRVGKKHGLGRALKGEGQFEEAEAVWSDALDPLTDLIAAEPDTSTCDGFGATVPMTSPGLRFITPGLLA